MVYIGIACLCNSNDRSNLSSCRSCAYQAGALRRSEGSIRSLRCLSECNALILDDVLGWFWCFRSKRSAFTPYATSQSYRLITGKYRCLTNQVSLSPAPSNWGSARPENCSRVRPAPAGQSHKALRKTFRRLSLWFPWGQWMIGENTAIEQSFSPSSDERLSDRRACRPARLLGTQRHSPDGLYATQNVDFMFTPRCMAATIAAFGSPFCGGAACPNSRLSTSSGSSFRRS